MGHLHSHMGTWELAESPSPVMRRCLEVDSEAPTDQWVSRSWSTTLPQPAPGLSFPLEVPMDIGGSLCCAEDYTSDHAKLTWSAWGCFLKRCWLLQYNRLANLHIAQLPLGQKMSLSGI